MQIFIPALYGNLQGSDVVNKGIIYRGERCKFLPLVINVKVLSRGFVEKLHCRPALYLLSYALHNLGQLGENLFHPFARHVLRRVTICRCGRFVFRQEPTQRMLLRRYAQEIRA